MSGISVKNLTKTFKDVVAVDDLTFSFPEGKVTCLLGPSGCGKTTFLRCLNRMNDSIDICRVKGSLQLDDLDIYHNMRDGDALRARVWVVFR